MSRPPRGPREPGDAREAGEARGPDETAAADEAQAQALDAPETVDEPAALDEPATSDEQATSDEPSARPPSIPVGAAAPKPRSETHPDTDEIEVVLPLSVVRVVPGSREPDGAARPGARPAPGARPEVGRPGQPPRPAPAGRSASSTRPARTAAPASARAAAASAPAAGARGPAQPGTSTPAPGSGRQPAPDTTASSLSPEVARGAARAAMTPGQRFRSALRPRMTRAQVLAAVLCAVLGFALVVQLQQNQQDEFSGLRQSDLVRILDDVSKRSDSLEREASSLRETEFDLRSGSDSQQAAIELAEKNAEIQGILSGRLPAEGPGLELQIQQGDTQISAARLFNVLEELRNAGAEAIDVNGIRMVTSSHFEDTAVGVSIDGIVVAPPYRWTVIGDPQTLEPAMAIPGGAVASITTSGGRTTIEQKELVQIRSVRDPSEPRFATPATDE